MATDSLIQTKPFAEAKPRARVQVDTNAREPSNEKPQDKHDGEQASGNKLQENGHDVGPGSGFCSRCGRKNGERKASEAVACPYCDQNGRFDAAATSHPPAHFLAHAPKNEPAVRLGWVSDYVGLGLFAARDIEAGEYIIHEKHLMCARYDAQEPMNSMNLKDQLRTYNNADAENSTGLRFAYPRVARDLGRKLPEWQHMVDTNFASLGANLVHGRFDGLHGVRDSEAGPDDNVLTEARYQKWVDLGPPLYTGQDQERCRKVVHEFFHNYAFRTRPITSDDMDTTKDNACIYLLTSLFNQCCRVPGTNEVPDDKTRGPNCEFSVHRTGLNRFLRPKHIAIKARRDVREGEELTIDYGKKKQAGFRCQCVTCNEARRSGIGGKVKSGWDLLARNLRRARKAAEGDQ